MCQKRACSNNRCCFQRRFDLKFRARSGPRYPPSFIRVAHMTPADDTAARGDSSKRSLVIICKNLNAIFQAKEREAGEITPLLRDLAFLAPTELRI